MYRAVIFTFDPIPKTNIKLLMNIAFGTFKSKEEAEKEANSVEKVILQTNPLSIKIKTLKNEYVVNNNAVVYKKVKNKSIYKTTINDDDFELLEDFSLEDLKRYFSNGYSFRVVAYNTKRIPVIIDEFHQYTIETDKAMRSLSKAIEEMKERLRGGKNER